MIGGEPPRYPANFDEYLYDWDKIQKERKEVQERKENEKISRLQRAEIKEKSWELLRLCKEIIRENDPTWQEGKYRAEMRKLRREEEERKEERRDYAREKQKKWRENYIQTTIAEKLTKTSSKEKQEWEQFLLLDKEEREYRLEVAEAKENLWRWRGTRKSSKEEKMRKGYTIGGEEKLEKRLEKLKEILEKSKMEREKEKKREEEMRKAVHSKLDKEKEERRRRLELKRRQEEKWGMIRWLTDFMVLEINSVEQFPQTTSPAEKVERLFLEVSMTV